MRAIWSISAYHNVLGKVCFLFVNPPTKKDVLESFNTWMNERIHLPAHDQLLSTLLSNDAYPLEVMENGGVPPTPPTVLKQPE